MEIMVRKMNILYRLKCFYILFLFLLCIMSCFAFEVEAPSNIPDDVHISVEQGFVYAGGTYKQKVKSPNSFKISAYRTGNSQYHLVMNEAVLIVDNKKYKLVQPSSIKKVLNNEQIPSEILFKEQKTVFPSFYAPVENIYYTKLLNRYTEPVKMSFIGAYAFPVKFNDKRSVLKDKESCILEIPLLNIETNKKEILTYKVQFSH